MGSRSAFIVPLRAGNRARRDPKEEREASRGESHWRETREGTMNPSNLFTKRRWIAELTRRYESPSISECRWAMIGSYDHLRYRQRNSPAKNRMREICTSGSVRGEGGNILTYSAGSKQDVDGRDKHGHDSG
jgi:hypothetical protein